MSKETFDFELEFLAPPADQHELFEGEWNRIAKSFGAHPYILKNPNGQWTMVATFAEDNLNGAAGIMKFWEDLGFHAPEFRPKKSLI